MTKNAGNPKGFWGGIMIKKMNAGHLGITQWALKNIKIPRSGNILDIGCGGGNCIKLLSSITKCKIYGVDHSPLCVSNALKKNKRSVKAGDVKILNAEVDSLPFKDDSVDCAIAIESVYFWNNPDPAFAEIRRVIKPGGELSIVCEMVKGDDGTGDHKEVAELLKLNYYSKMELETIFKRNGFNSVQSIFDKKKTWLLISGKK